MMRMSAIKMICVALVSLSLVRADEDIILAPPVNDTVLPSLMVVFVPGGNVPNDHYVATATAIQNAASSSVSVWFVIPAVFQRLCIISCAHADTTACAPLHSDVTGALSKAEKMGWTRNANKDGLFLMGHSLGGVCSNSLIQAYPKEFGGLVTMASYVDETGAYDLTNYPVPVLHLGAELDGLTRPGQLALWFRQFKDLYAHSTDALLDKPVLVLPGLNHSDFCPGFPVPGDLNGEVNPHTATATIGATVAAYLAIQTHRSAPSSADVNTIKTALSFTSELLGAYIEVEDLTYSLDNHTSKKNPKPKGTSAMCQRLQHTVAQLPAALARKLIVVNDWYPSSSELEYCHTSFSQSHDGSVTVETCAETDYYNAILDGTSCQAAKQMSCKFESTVQIAQAFNITAQPQVDCMSLNTEVIQLAESRATPGTLARYKTKGRSLCLKPDYQTPGNVGPLWLLESMSYTDTAECMEIQSPTLLTSLSSAIYPGNFYCKLLSPEKVLDWMMTDSMRPFSK